MSAPAKTNAELALAETFFKIKTKLPGDNAILAQREAAFERFAALGLPHRRVEEWKYTDLRARLRDAKPLASAPAAADRAKAGEAGKAFAGLGFRKLTFVEGAFAPDLSDLGGLESGLTIRPMAEALAAGDPLVVSHLGKVVPVSDSLVNVNTALMGDGVVIHVAARAAIGRPLHLAFATVGDKPSAEYVRSLIVVEEGAALALLETHDGKGAGEHQINAAIELMVGEEARIDHANIVNAGAESLHVGSLMAAIGARATFNGFTLVTGGAVVRNQMFLRFDGADTMADIRGASLLKGRQHADTSLFAEHIAPGCQAHEIFKSVLDGEARGVFQGKITVRSSAQRTDAKMRSQALLLSESAEADHKPELEIFADDVKCGHGATAGALDEEARFYLMTRGIPSKEAEALLVQGFVGEAVDVIAHDELKAAVMDATAAWLAARG
jgi:Fe-S cluster assembly protein SufD